MQSPQITPSLPLGQAPHAVRRPHAEPPPPASIFRFFYATFVLHAIPRPPHTWAASSYGIAVSPYGHTPDAFPHTFWQIPTGRPFSHTPRQIPHSQAISQYNPHLDKAAGFHFDETSGSSSTNPQPTPSSKHPEPALPSGKPIANRFQQITCVTVQQTKRRPSPANHTYLRLGGAVTSCAYGHGHARTFTAMCTWSRAHSLARARP